MPPKVEVYLSLGSNLATPLHYLSLMESELKGLLQNFRSSPLYKTTPIGVDTSHNDYYNRVVYGIWEGSAYELLWATQEIEQHLGRKNKGELAPRTADIDILLFGDHQYNFQDLVIPHHALLQRKFHILGITALNDTALLPSGELLQEVVLDSSVLQQGVIELL